MDEEMQLAIQENYIVNSAHKNQILGLTRDIDPELERVILNSIMEERKQDEDHDIYSRNQIRETHQMKKPVNIDVNCIICFERRSNTIFAPCLHKDFCHYCAEKIFKRGNAMCPLCKTKLIEYQILLI